MQIVKQTALVTGSAGFIGFHVCRKLLMEGWNVIGVDAMDDYYDVNLKKRREDILLKSNNFELARGRVEQPAFLHTLFEKHRPSIVIHLAAQAGVRYSLHNSKAYLESNVIGTYELLESIKSFPVKHALIASTSSVYGANKKLPYSEADKADAQISFYAATKKSIENFSHCYSHLYQIPTTVFRFFTVYGPWGRPDMALFKFTDQILNGKPIEVYNNGDMKRDFTYIDDLVEVVFRLITKPPNYEKDENIDGSIADNYAANYRVVNIGNSDPVNLMDFIEAIELCLGKVAIKKFLPMQPGDVHSTSATTELIEKIVGFRPKMPIEEGVRHFVNWYRDYYQQ